MLARFFSYRQNCSGGFSTSVSYLSLFLFLFAICFQPHPVEAGNGSSLTARLVNIESEAKTPFRYSASLYNGSAKEQVFDLQAGLPSGWNVLFRAEGNQVTALKVDPDKTLEVSIEIVASPLTKPGKYKIPVTAVSATESLNLELEAVVKGNYDLQLTTPTGRLSDEITEGKSKQLVLTVMNTGTLPLDELELTAQTPLKWMATFEPSKIQRLEPGKSQNINVLLSVPDKTIAGDYLTTFTARNSYSNANASFRMTVKTSVLSGWVGLLIIALAIIIVYNLIRKYGRR
jgi:uncharacterized membrane protein